MPHGHSCQYAKDRSELVRIAASHIATERVLSAEGKRLLLNDNQFTRRFAFEMERLAAPLLRQSGNGTSHPPEPMTAPLIGA
jgi:hypothetical protein